MAETAMRRLHIGATGRTPGWEVFDANAGAHVDHQGDAKDMSRFADATFGEVYASHVAEHFDYMNDLSTALREWRRVLMPGGRLYLSVPDLDVLARMFIDREHLNADERFFVMRIIFGGHVDDYDYHMTGLNEEFLTAYLVGAGFANLQRVGEFGLFKDSSAMRYKGVAISLNMVAERPLED